MKRPIGVHISENVGGEQKVYLVCENVVVNEFSHRVSQCACCRENDAEKLSKTQGTFLHM